MSTSKAKDHLERARDGLLRIGALSNEIARNVRLAAAMSTDTDLDYWQTIFSHMGELDALSANLLRYLMREPPQAMQQRLPIDTLEPCMQGKGNGHLL